MELLKDKQTRPYDYLSRYASCYFYYNTADDKYIYGLTKQINSNIPFTIHKLRQSDTLDNLANRYYGRPDYF